jgi:signal transduction histidine kinase
MASTNHIGNQRVRHLVVAGVVLLSYGLSIGTSLLLYRQNRELFKLSLDDRLRTVAAVAAAKFDPEVLAELDGPDAVGTPGYKETVLKLQETRLLAEDIRFAYILRRTSDPNELAFVADADSLDPEAEVDLNGDGLIDDEDSLAWPGDPYDVTDFPELRTEAFLHPFVDPELFTDSWGTFLSGHAPIRSDPSSTARASFIIGLDMEVSRYQDRLNVMLVPFVSFVAFLLVLITTLAVLLTKMWDRQVGQLVELDRQKDDLIHIVSHQLAAPVTATKFYLETMLDDGDKLGPEVKDGLTTLQSLNADLSDLVDMILDVARIQLGRMKSEPLPLDLKEFFGEVLAVIEPRAKGKPVELRVEMPEVFPEAKLDRRLTRITVENLLTNAVKYTPVNGRVDLRVTAQGGTLTVVVADTGCGIPKSEQDKIFGKQYRASNVRNTIEGNGFGLFAAKGAVESQGGTIGFTSAEGKGTTFTITLPLQP